MSQPNTTTSIIATFPPGFFLENILLLHSDTLLIVVPNRQELYALPPPPPSTSPASQQSLTRSPILLHKFPKDEWTMGMCLSPSNPNLVYLMTTDFIGKGRKIASLYTVNPAVVATGSDPVKLMEFPSNAKGINGLCLVNDRLLLAADSFEGVIWRIDVELDTSSSSSSSDLRDVIPKSAKATEWLRHPEFNGTLTLPDFQPGANGIKYSPSSSYVCFSNSQKRTFGRIKLDPKTGQAVGQPEILARGMQGDDLIIHEGGHGGPTAYLTTHRDNTLLQIPITGDAAKEVQGKVVVEGTKEDRVLVGPTAGVWEHGQEGKVAYFTCDGGLKHPFDDGVIGYARVVKVEF